MTADIGQLTDMSGKLPGIGEDVLFFQLEDGWIGVVARWYGEKIIGLWF